MPSHDQQTGRRKRALICDPSSLEYFKLSYLRVMPVPTEFLIFGKDPYVNCCIYIVANNIWGSILRAYGIRTRRNNTSFNSCIQLLFIFEKYSDICIAYIYPPALYLLIKLKRLISLFEIINL